MVVGNGQNQTFIGVSIYPKRLNTVSSVENPITYFDSTGQVSKSKGVVFSSLITIDCE